jgi:hypothetical protein
VALQPAQFGVASGTQAHQYNQQQQLPQSESDLLGEQSGGLTAQQPLGTSAFDDHSASEGGAAGDAGGRPGLQHDSAQQQQQQQQGAAWGTGRGHQDAEHVSDVDDDAGDDGAEDGARSSNGAALVDAPAPGKERHFGATLWAMLLDISAGVVHSIWVYFEYTHKYTRQYKNRNIHDVYVLMSVLWHC